MEGGHFCLYHQVKYWALSEELWDGQDRESQKIKHVFKKQSLVLLSLLSHAIEEEKREEMICSLIYGGPL